MAEEIDVHRVWAKDTAVEPGVLRFAHYEIAGVKYADVHLYGVADGVGTWRATVRIKGSEIDDLVMTLVPDMSRTRLVDPGDAALKLLEQHPELPAGLNTQLRWHILRKLRCCPCRTGQLARSSTYCRSARHNQDEKVTGTAARGGLR